MGPDAADEPLQILSRTLSAELGRGVRAPVFAAASACLGLYLGDRWHFVDAAAGSRGAGLGELGPEACFDLASLTKPLVAALALRLAQRGRFESDADLRQLLPEAEGHPLGRCRWTELMTHRSGLAAWRPFFESAPHAPGTAAARDWVLSELLKAHDPAQRGTAVYSDLGYMLIGQALERTSGMSLADLLRTELTAPLQLTDALFFASARRDTDWLSRCVPTGWSAWRGRELCGEVHDDNCSFLGGVAGHAGVFGTAAAVARFAAVYMDAWQQRPSLFDPEAVQAATRARPGGSHKLGWDGVSKEGSAGGARIDSEGFGHLGFTGTSVWCDPRRQAVLVLLSNRVAVSEDNAAIRAFRPRFYDALWEAVDSLPAVIRRSSSREFVS